MATENAARNIPASAVQVAEKLDTTGRDIVGRFEAQGIDLNISGRWVQSLQEKVANAPGKFV